MNHDTTACTFPALTSDFLRNGDRLIDDIFADLWKKIGVETLRARCGFHKRSGIEVNAVLYEDMNCEDWNWAVRKSECMDCRASLAMTLDPNTHNDGF